MICCFALKQDIPLQPISNWAKRVYYISFISIRRYPDKFLNEISMEGDQFWTDVYALLVIISLMRVCAYFLLRGKLMALR